MRPLVAAESLPGREHAEAVGALVRLLRLGVLLAALAFWQWLQRGRAGRRRSAERRRAAAAPAAAHVAGTVAPEGLVRSEHLLARGALVPRPLLLRRGGGGGGGGHHAAGVVVVVVGVEAERVRVRRRRRRGPGVAGEHHQGQRDVLLRRGRVGDRAHRLRVPRSGVRALGVRRRRGVVVRRLALAIREVGVVVEADAALGILLPQHVPPLDGAGLLLCVGSVVVDAAAGRDGGRSRRRRGDLRLSGGNGVGAHVAGEGARAGEAAGA